MKTQNSFKNLKKLCTTFNNSFVLEQMLEEFNVKVIERLPSNVGVEVLVNCTEKLAKQLDEEFKHQCNHHLIVIA